MRLVHTADWHLGHTLGGHSRDLEHVRFLSWLLDVLDETAADALLIAGDVFDAGNPPAQAQARYYDFLAAARRRRPQLSIVVIGGNHDAAPRLDAPGPVLSTMGVCVVGGLPRDDSGQMVATQCLVPLRNAQGEVAAVVAAVPHLRAADLPRVEPGFVDGAVDGTVTGTVTGTMDGVVDGVRAGVGQIWREVLAAAAIGWPGVPIISLAHAHLEGARLSLASERPIFGNTHALPAHLLAPDGVSYAALGHLHLAQALGDGRARYAGSPIPLSMAERNYEHQVVVVDVNGGKATIRPRFVPRTVDLLRVPGDDGALSLPEVLDALQALSLPDVPLEERPFLEVRVRLEEPIPDLRARVEQVLEGKPVRLVRIHRETQGDGRALAVLASLVTPGTTALQELSPQAVFSSLYARTYGGDPGDALRAAFRQVCDEVMGDVAKETA